MDNMTTVCKLVGRTIALMRDDKARTAILDCLHNGVALTLKQPHAAERVDTLSDFISAFLFAVSEYVEECI